MMKRLGLSGFAWVLLLSVATFAAFPQSASYKIPVSGTDAGGAGVTSNTYSLTFQSFGPAFKGSSTANSKTTIQGLHFSSEVHSLIGFSNPDRAIIPLTAQENGTITTKVEFLGTIDGVTQSILVDLVQGDGWKAKWDTLPLVDFDASSKLLVRAYDGISWGPFYETSAFTVDNAKPTINNLIASANGLALNSGQGQLSSSWAAVDNVDGSLSYDVSYIQNNFSPKSLTGLHLWLDAAYDDGFVYGDGTKVATWWDRSGYDHHFTQALAAGQPTRESDVVYGLPTVRFDGAQSHMIGGDKLDTLFAGSNAKYTMFAVIKSPLAPAGSSFQTILSKYEQNNNQRGVRMALKGESANTFAPYLESNDLNGSSRLSVLGSRNFYQNDFRVISFTMDQTEALAANKAQLWVNGRSTAISNPDTQAGEVADNTADLLLGAYRNASSGTEGYLNGDIAEVIIYNRLLSDADRQQVEDYLSFKWAAQRFDPRQLSDLRLWLDADDSDAFTLSGSSVSQWQDKSGFANHADQNTGAQQPTRVTSVVNGNAIVRFDGGDVLALANPENFDLSTFTIIAYATPGGTLVAKGDAAQGSGHDAYHKLHVGLTSSALTLKSGNSSKSISKSLSSVSGFQVIEVLSAGNTDHTLSHEQADDTYATSLANTTFNEKSMAVGSAFADSLSDAFTGDIAEIMVFARPLSSAERDRIRDYLDAKWNASTGLAYTSAESNTSATAWNQAGRPDNAYYQVKVIARDDAGNETVTVSVRSFTPDRTAPTIGVVDAGTIISNFNEIYATEDINFVKDFSPYEWDLYSNGIDLDWTIESYTNINANPALQDAYKSIEEIVQSITVTDSDANTVSGTVSPNANTGTALGAAIEPGNIYGKEAAFIRVTLADKAGNSVSKDVRVHVQAVNDKPVFAAELLPTDNSLFFKNAGNEIKYNIRTNEDTVSQVIPLSTLITDVDDLLSDLTITVSQNNLFQVGSIPFDGSTHSKFQSTYITAEITNSAAGFGLTFTPAADWYGDQHVTINVSDGDAIPTFDEKPFIVRVWPVNDAPVISASLPKTFSVDEDNNLVLALQGYEDDAILEDKPPTHNNKLNWSIVTYNHTLVAAVDGENSSSDNITFTPTANAYGVSTVVLQLTDTDDYAESVFGLNEPTPYTRSPLSTTVAVTVTWNPVNDPPSIGAVANQDQNEDSSAWQLDLSSFKSDIEDTGVSLSYGIQIGDTALVTHSYHAASNTITFTPVANAFGTTNVTLTLQDTDDINFPGYTANPITVTKDIVLTLNAVNDLPTLTGFSVLASGTGLSDKSMSSDALTATAVGYTDVSNEYSTNSIPGLGHTQNTENYHFKWTVVSDNTTIVLQENTGLTSSINAYNVANSLEGKTVTVTVWPNDGVASGNGISKAVYVNTRPSISDFSGPAFDFYYNVTQNVGVSWNAATDPDSGEDIGYRLKVWKVSQWDSPPPTVDINDAGAYYDSDWQEGGTFLSYAQTILDGDYYWTVFSGNKYGPTTWDYRQPDWVQKFHVDTIDPSISSPNQFLNVKEIVNAGGQPVEDAGRTRIIFGNRPADVDDGYRYSIWLEMFNEQVVSGSTVASYNLSMIVATTNAETWSYQITYPPGRTTYNIFLQDLAGNRSTYHTFVIGEDQTAPSVPTLLSAALSLVNGEYVAISSANYFQVTGNKEAESSLWYSGVQIVGYTDETNYSMLVYPQKPIGYLTAKDRAGNESAGVTINLTFLQGPPVLTLESQTRSIINAEDNPLIASLDSATKDAIKQSDVTWKSNRKISSYKLQHSGGAVVKSGATVEADTNQLDVVAGNNAALSEGDNVLTYLAYDEAGNVGRLDVNIKRLTQAPTTNIITAGEASLQSGKWIVDLNGQLPDNTTVFIKVDGVDQTVSTFNNDTWKFFDANFDLENKDITMLLRDDVYNEATRLVWDHNSYNSNDSTFAISAFDPLVLPYEQLPSNIIRLYMKRILNGNADLSTGLRIQAVSRLFESKSNVPDLKLTDPLKNSVYQLYGKSFFKEIVSEGSLAGLGIQVKIPYADSIHIEEDRLVVMSFNEDLLEWQKTDHDYKVDKINNEVTAVVDKMGIWALGEFRPFASDLSTLRVWPNPFVPNDGNADTGSLSGSNAGITFDNLTTNSKIRIYTVSGQLVREHDATGSTSWVWDAKNQDGRDVFSDVYIYVVRDGADTKTGKLTIIR